jgi:hemolysin activation/secretion protein
MSVKKRVYSAKGLLKCIAVTVLCVLSLHLETGFTQEAPPREPAATNADEPENAVGASDSSGRPPESSQPGTSTQESKTPEPKFYVGEFRVKGNSILNSLAIELALTPFLGEEKTVRDIEAARQALELRYRDAGYPTVLVNIPEQNVVDGIVLLEVIEGRVEELLVTGSRYFSLDRIKQQVPALSEGSVPYIPGVQEQLAGINKATADRQITPVLRPGRTPGTLEVELKVKDTLPLHGGIEVNDRYSQDTTKTRLTGHIQYDNLWQKEHSFSLQYQTAPEEPKEVQVFAGTYLWKMLTSDNLVVLYGVSSDSETAAVGTISVIGKGKIAGTRLVAPLAPGDSYFHSMSAGFDYKDFDESVTLIGSDTNNTPIDYVNWALQYNGTIRELKTFFGFGVGANFGIRGLVNDTKQFEDKRFNARPNYFYLRLEANYETALFLDTQFIMRLNAQIADSPLISNEQFSAGGAYSVRGYYESQELGDNAVQGNIELVSADLYRNVKAGLDGFKLFVFADGAYLQTKDPLPLQDAETGLYSSGLGARVVAWKNLVFDAAWAVPLKESGEIEKYEDRWHLKLEYKF